MCASRWCWGFGIALGLVAGSARADEKSEAKQREAKELLAVVKDAGFYGLRDPKEKEAIARLHKLGADAVPAVTEMLADGLKNRKQGWIEVYRPLFILRGFGEDAKVALPDLIKSLDDEHPINVFAAAKVLEQIGPPAKAALPKLEKVWAAETTDGPKVDIGRAIKAIDPKAAQRLGIGAEDA